MMEALKNNVLIINVLALRHKAQQKTNEFKNLSRFDVDVLLICSQFTRENAAFEVGELAKFSGHDSSNLNKSIKKLERNEFLVCVSRPRKWYRSYTYTLTGKGAAALRRFCNLYKSEII